ncbi:MAG: host-nuclease inhibitor Gam family protein [Deltaproteobacteria bacterium]|nr:host-nuclease inhibitor Gam family protein [Deltaproteobacteria bacterium]
MATARKLKAPEIDTPQTLEAAEEALGELGRLQRQVDEIQRRMNDKLAKIKEEHEAKAAPLTEELERLFKGLQAWAEAHKTSLLQGKEKTVRLGTGELGWRTSPPSVSLSKIGVVIEALKLHGLERFLRTKQEVNKDAILADPEAVEGIKGISVGQAEAFWAKPYESQIERSAKARSAKARKRK